LSETLGGAAKQGWSPRKERRFEFLPRRKRCRNRADQPFLILECAVFVPGWRFRFVFLRAKEKTLRLGELDVRGEVAIAGERLEETGGEWSIDALE
jgi:hypothetical protein